MHLEFRRIVAIGLLVMVLSGCSTSTGTINTPIGAIQIGMYLDEVQDVLGQGSVLEQPRTQGAFVIETHTYPSNDGRTYVVYYVDEVVRRWELKELPPTASPSESQ
jgi:hypothetical protein